MIRCMFIILYIKITYDTTLLDHRTNTIFFVPKEKINSELKYFKDMGHALDM